MSQPSGHVCIPQPAAPDGTERARLLAIVGPTAVGKTDLALRVASRVPVEIVSADSRQVYRYMDIGTAKPSPAQLLSVQHHAIDVVDPDEGFGLVNFMNLANEAIRNAKTRGNLPILVGGTGQYVMAILEGWDVPRVPPDPALRRSLELELGATGASGLARKLEEVAPGASSRVDIQNPRRLIRAIELAIAGHPGGTTRRRSALVQDLMVIGLTLDRRALYSQADCRVNRMIRSGFVAEVASLLDSGYAPELPSMSGIGYREIAEHLLADADLDEAIRRVKSRTHRYIRQQANWFKPGDIRISWFDTADVHRAVDAAVRWASSSGST